MPKLSSVSLGKALLDAIESRDPTALADAVGRLKAACGRRDMEADLVTEAIKELRNHRQFSFSVDVADVAMTSELAEHESRRLYAQGLTDLGLLHTAEIELNRLLSEDLEDKEKGEVLGLLGRNYKQRFVESDPKSDYRRDHLRKAIGFYLTAYDAGTDPAWHGANLVALLARAEEEKIPLSQSLARAVEPLARDVLAVARTKREEVRNVWERATEVEILVAQGKLDEAAEIATKLTRAELATPFELASLRRQLIEVWKLEPSHRLLAAIDNSNLDLGASAAVDLPAGEFERLFGNVPVSYATYRRGLTVARYVGMVTDVNGEGWGTGFLIPGRELHEGLGEDLLLVTNSHVVCTQKGIAPLVPEAARVEFEALPGPHGQPLTLSFKNDDQLFTSDPYALDCTILRVTAEIPLPDQPAEPIERAPAMPTVDKDAYVYVIGHPMRAGLSLSIRGNGLLAIDEDQARLHYKAPTEKGSSGSPVFDRAWQLIGLHHYGSEKIQKLDGSGAVYQANEGISIAAIRESFMEEYQP